MTGQLDAFLDEVEVLMEENGSSVITLDDLRAVAANAHNHDIVGLLDGEPLPGELRLAAHYRKEAVLLAREWLDPAISQPHSAEPDTKFRAIGLEPRYIEAHPGLREAPTPDRRFQPHSAEGGRDE